MLFKVLLLKVQLNDVLHFIQAPQDEECWQKVMVRMINEPRAGANIKQVMGQFLKQVIFRRVAISIFFRHSRGQNVAAWLHGRN